MAVIRRIEASRPIDIGGVPAIHVDDSVGRGLQRLGAAISDFSATSHRLEMARIEHNQRIDEFATNQALQRLSDDMAAEFAQTQANIDPSGKGFTETVSGIFNKRAEQFLQGVPDYLKPKFSELLQTARNQWLDKAAAAEVDQRNSWYRQGITERAETLQRQVFNDPTMFDAAKEDAFRLIDASGLPPVEKEALKKQVSDVFSLAVGEREIYDTEKDPSRARDAAQRLGITINPGIEEVADRIISVESGGKSNAKNQNSTATGAGQFIESTWLAMIRRYRPDIAAGKSRAEILALRNDAQLSREMTTRYAQENVKILSANGIAQTEGNIYLAHFLGPAGAVAVLKAGSDAPLESILGADVVKANPFLKGKTAAWVKNWAEKKMGGAKPGAPTPEDPRYANLTLEQRLKIYDQIMAAAQRGQTAIQAQQKALYDAEKGALELGIQTGEVVSVQQIMASNLTDAHKADLISALRSRRGDEIAIAEAVQAFQAGSLTVDPYSAEGRKLVDGVYSALEKAAPPETLQVATEDLIQQTGIVPQKVHNALRAGVESTVPTEVEAALVQADRINRMSPAILGRRDGGDEIQQKADLFDTLVRKMGYTPAEAAKRIAEQNDPEKARQRKALLASDEVKNVLKQVDDSYVLKGFGGLISRIGLRLGQNDAQRAAMVAEYKDILQEAFVDANGDKDVARVLADKRFQRIYGVSEFTLDNIFTGKDGAAAGSDTFGKTITRLPPEKVYEPLPDGSFDYIGEQLRDALKAEGVEFDDVKLSAYTETDADFWNGEPPRYQVWYKQGGKWQLYNLPFFADRNIALEKYNAEQQRQLDERRQINEENKQREYHRQTGQDREQSMDAYLFGNPLSGEVERQGAVTTPQTPEPQAPRQRAGRVPKVFSVDQVTNFDRLSPEVQQKLRELEGQDMFSVMPTLRGLFMGQRQQIIDETMRRR